MLLIKFTKTVCLMLDLHAQQPVTMFAHISAADGFLGTYVVWHRGQGGVWCVWCERIEMVLSVGREDVSG